MVVDEHAIGRTERHPLLGRIVGGCALVRWIGRGGMGEVFEAESLAPRRRVAVKLLAAADRDDELPTRMRREASLLALLEHPNIARLYASGIDSIEGRRSPYLVLELVPGGRPLTEWAADRRLTVAERIRLVAAAARAVGFAHTKSIIHRDLKPANLLVDAEGSVKVIDFGIARLLTEERGPVTAVTEAGRLLGTVQYMAPEQFDADPSLVDTRTDVYALGLVLFELIAGRPPYDLDGLTLIQAARVVAEEPIDRLHGTTPGVPRDLDAVLAKALAKPPSERYASANELAGDLERLERHEPVAARTLTLGYQLRKVVARHRALTAVTAVALLCLFLMLGVVFAAFRSAERVAYRAALQGASASLAADEAVDARRLLESAPRGQRGWEWRALMNATGRLAGETRPEREREEEPDHLYRIDHAADANRLLVAVRNRLLTLDGDSGALLASIKVAPSALLAPPNDDRGTYQREVDDVDVTPDGRFAALSWHQGTVAAIDASTGATRWEHAPHERDFSPVAITADGAELIWSPRPGALERVRIADGTTEEIGPATDGAWDVLDIRQADGLLAAVGAGGRLRLAEPGSSGRTVDWLLGELNDPREVAFVPGRKALVVADGSSGVWELSWSELAAEPAPTIRRIGALSEAGTRGIGVSSDGRFVAVALSDGHVDVHALEDDRRVARLGAHDGIAWDAAFAVGGRQLVTSSYGLRRWEIPPPRPASPLRSVRLAAVSAMGEAAVLVASDGTVRTIDAETGNELRVVEGLPPIRAVDVAGRGAVLACGISEGQLLLFASPRSPNPNPNPNPNPKPEHSKPAILAVLPPGEEISALRLIEGGRAVAVGGDNGTVAVVDTDPPAIRWTGSVAAIEHPPEGEVAITGFGEGENDLLVIGARHMLTRFLADRRTGAELRPLVEGGNDRSTRIPKAVDAVPGLAVFVGGEGYVASYAPADGTRRWQGNFRQGEATAVAIRPQADRVVVARGRRISVIDASRPIELCQLPVLPAAVRALGFSADGDALTVVLADGSLVRFDGRPIGSAPRGE
jgi:WD40 repeat protein